MTGKLIKYEFKSIARLMGILWIALPVCALLLGLTDNRTYNIDNAFFDDILSLVTLILYVSVFVAMIAVTTVVIVMRFYKGLMRQEGYLMHTLPVKTWQLITAKGIVSTCVVLISGLISILSILLLNSLDGLRSLVDAIQSLFATFHEYPDSILSFIELIFFMLTGIISGIYHIYVSLAIGHLAKKHRILFSLLSYIGISIVCSVINTKLFTLLQPWMTKTAAYTIQIPVANIFANVFEMLQAACLISILFSIIEILIFHFATEYILRKHLNLE